MTSEDLIIALCRPSTWWGRLRVDGLESVPEAGPLLVVPNHDSQWDGVVVGLAIRPRRRLLFLARASLWRIPGVGPILNTLGQIPVQRGAGDSAAVNRAIDVLRAGGAVGIFPEGRLSWGETLRPRSGVGRLAAACPGVRVVLCSVTGATDYVRFPRRPRVTVTFFRPRGGDPSPGEDPTALSSRLLAELRERVPPTPAGRWPVVGGPLRVRQRAARHSDGDAFTRDAADGPRDPAM